MMRNNNFYDICHEHLSYYSLESFEFLLKKLKLKLFYAETNGIIKSFDIDDAITKDENGPFIFPNQSDFIKEVKQV